MDLNNHNTAQMASASGLFKSMKAKLGMNSNKTRSQENVAGPGKGVEPGIGKAQLSASDSGKKIPTNGVEKSSTVNNSHYQTREAMLVVYKGACWEENPGRGFPQGTPAAGGGQARARGRDNFLGLKFVDIVA